MDSEGRKTTTENHIRTIRWTTCPASSQRCLSNQYSHPKFLVKRLLIDDKSAVNALSWNAYKAMGGSITDLKAIKSLITSFCGGITQPMSVTELTIEFDDQETRDTKTVKSLFNIMDLLLTYNGIIGRPILYEIDAATSIRWLSIKIPLEDRVITILGDQTMAQ